MLEIIITHILSFQDTAPLSRHFIRQVFPKVHVQVHKHQVDGNNFDAVIYWLVLSSYSKGVNIKRSNFTLIFDESNISLVFEQPGLMHVTVG